MKKKSVFKKIVILVVVLSFLVGMVVVPSFAQPSTVIGEPKIRERDRMVFDMRFAPLFWEDAIYGTDGIPGDNYYVGNYWLVDDLNVAGHNITAFQQNMYDRRWRVTKEVSANDVNLYASYTLTEQRSSLTGSTSALSTNFVGSIISGNQSVARKAVQSFHSPRFFSSEASWIPKHYLDSGCLCFVGFYMPSYIVDNYIAHTSSNEMNIVNLNENMSVSLVYEYEVGYVGENGFLEWRTERNTVQYGDYSYDGTLSNSGTIDDILFSGTQDFSLFNDGYYINSTYFHNLTYSGQINQTKDRYVVAKLDLYEGLPVKEYVANGIGYGLGALVRNVDIRVEFNISNAMFDQWRDEISALQDLGAQYSFDEFEGIYKRTMFKDVLGEYRVPFIFVSFPGNYNNLRQLSDEVSMNFITDFSKGLGDKEAVNLTSDPIEWLADTVSGILSINLFGTISIGDIMYIVLGVGLFFIILKIFAGG